MTCCTSLKFKCINSCLAKAVPMKVPRPQIKWVPRVNLTAIKNVALFGASGNKCHHNLARTPGTRR